MGGAKPNPSHQGFQGERKSRPWVAVYVNDNSHAERFQRLLNLLCNICYGSSQEARMNNCNEVEQATVNVAKKNRPSQKIGSLASVNRHFHHMVGIFRHFHHLNKHYGVTYIENIKAPSQR